MIVRTSIRLKRKHKRLIALISKNDKLHKDYEVLRCDYEIPDGVNINCDYEPYSTLVVELLRQKNRELFRKFKISDINTREIEINWIDWDDYIVLMKEIINREEIK